MPIKFSNICNEIILLERDLITVWDLKFSQQRWWRFKSPVMLFHVDWSPIFWRNKSRHFQGPKHHGTSKRWWLFTSRHGVGFHKTWTFQFIVDKILLKMDSVYDPFLGTFEHSNEPRRFIKGREFLDYLRYI